MQKVQTKKEKIHKSVLTKEVLEALGLDDAHLNHQASYIDATIGLGGHTLEIVKRGGTVLGIDMDNEMLNLAEERLANENSYKLVLGNFKDIKSIAERENFTDVDGILFDLGVSNIQLTSDMRGFSFNNKEALLDMRIDTSGGPTAADLLNVLRRDQLTDLFSQVLTDFESKKIALEIVEFRKNNPIKTTSDFLSICEKVFKKQRNINPATRAFLALRMAVNSELENLQEALPNALSLLKNKGRLVVISFHSGEDAIVKDFFNLQKDLGKGVVVNKKLIVPTEEEVRDNPKSRSAKLRILEKI
ncbi:16S rRNA (cytosine(1402)-N(4))-methyltransferase [Candidatus Woesebacteria bacterium RBG_16_36_11]|uniref:Ribosomal RNA small subunit methyltransferase H n=3 Tax=Candidatus Woeseibacteriota TaxID=1752722 RepID=A0A1F7X9I8_9BACT|nr:MAG: 16S rRNA (cytosine(1402)-N(4))-methyltransferase [Candidatus Woesebacteria bacterium RBG_13_36_22]OGM11696.1 MAG: 16S rRNA (cytosine(1402)-N(4))-methyltransferase [Candidatus Woesebacteria bacterium RBG_16_36_11]OGM16440.1 MAG: 16S rRNA (cytosine(1402)-N(4))-methyltransferase [Candidatus Woesebacteria bacterium RBG_19FT_COMBO_37_29]